MRTFALLAIILAVVSSVSADSSLRRLRRTAEAIEDAVHEKYLDLANLVTNGRTLRRVAERKNLRERKMIGQDNFSVMSARPAIYDLVGLGIVPAAPEAEVTQPEEDRVLEASMSMDVRGDMSMSM
jgi:hypothetical protein